ncbi:asparagine synthetase A [Amycolatopsis sp. DG1A-15b]|uniref:asparagine synthetase A n=1 Tax=Amycolatopsis sp. DG1A-15b TaxID=3052846 RepID=UPI00255BE647|nr:asparagine synthetase A [Amycolatopsis sp. DG1A-15b]WIX92958.1 asparagine synthetase A [Amycolatopsis sp. DG1A-15b]
MTDPDRRFPPPPGQHLRSPVTQRALRVQDQVLVAARAFLRQEGCIELPAPVVGPVTDPGVRGAKQLDVSLYGHRYKLMTSAILYKQASLTATSRLFCVAANLRAEPPETADTARHLVEFNQIDVELAHATRSDTQELLERLVTHVVKHVTEACTEDLTALGRDPTSLVSLLHEPFETLTHREAVTRLRELQHTQDLHAEISWSGEALLSQKAAGPFFITHYPRGSRGFYDRQDPDERDLLRNFDLLAPGGFGELASGGEREHDYTRVVTRMRETGENPAKYGWYLDVLRDGIPPSSGFGLGLERLTRFITGLDYLWQTTAYPKVPGQLGA